MHIPKSTIIAGVFASLTSLTALALPPEIITINDCVDKKSAVVFPHAAHYQHLKCATCHHTQENLTLESDEAVEPCSACHIKPEAADTPTCSQMSPKKNPFHIRCMGCHKEHEGEEKTGPTKCDDCHPKD